ncbi:MAG: TetR/AcrR family transcriptional regulator [Bacteroidales bacterium]
MELKERILAESFKQYSLNGIKSVTMDDIARAVGISKRTLYEIFADKEALVRACVIGLEQCRVQERDRFIATSPSVIEFFFAFLDHMSSEMKDFNRNFMRDMKRYHPKVYELHHQCKDQHTRDLIETVLRGQQQGVIRDDINVELSIRLVEIQVDNFWFSDTPEMTKFDIVEYFEQMILIYLRGICTPKGLELVEEYCQKRTREIK